MCHIACCPIYVYLSRRGLHNLTRLIIFCILRSSLVTRKETDRKSSFWYSKAACVSFAIWKEGFEPMIWYDRSWCIAMAVNVARTASEPSFRKMMCLATLWRPTKSVAARGFWRVAFGLSAFHRSSLQGLFHQHEVTYQFHAPENRT